MNISLNKIIALANAAGLAAYKAASPLEREYGDDLMNAAAAAVSVLHKYGITIDTDRCEWGGDCLVMFDDDASAR